MSETEAYTQLALMIGILLCIPFLWRFFFSLGKSMVQHFFPPKFLTIETKKLDGTIEIKKVKFDDGVEIIESLLNGGRIK